MNRTKLNLYNLLTNRFNEGELRTLCFALDLDYDDLSGSGKADKARELVAYLERRCNISQLVQIGEQLRPDIPWQNAVENITELLDHRQNVLGVVIGVQHKDFLKLKISKANQLQQFYQVSIEPSFQQLASIHKDYTANLLTLRNHLRDRSLSPQDLIRWLGEAGLQYRMEREYLSTIDSDLQSPAFNKLEDDDEKTAKYLEYYRRYVRSIVEYYRCTNSWHGLSLYRGSEYTLQYVFESSGGNETNRGKGVSLLREFYRHEEISNLIEELTVLCDIRLPQYWRAVSSAFRKLRISTENNII